MSNIVGTYTGGTYTNPNGPAAGTYTKTITISTGGVINGNIIYPATFAEYRTTPSTNPNVASTSGLVYADTTAYFVAIPNQPGSYQVYFFPNILVNPAGTATLNGNTLTLSDGSTFQKTTNATTPTIILPAAQSMSQINPNVTASLPTTSFAGMRVEEPQHTKIKHHRCGKKAGKRKH